MSPHRTCKEIYALEMLYIYLFVIAALNSTSEFSQFSVVQFVRFNVVILIPLADARIVQVLAQNIQIPAPSEWYG